jgi:hypothetical protein
MNQQKIFMFYTSWEKKLLKLNLEQRWTFIHNLIKYHSNRADEIELPELADDLVWDGVLPALEINQMKWEERANRSRENGKKNLGKVSININPKEPEKTQQVISEPKEPVNSKLLNGNSKMLIVNSQLENENSKQSTVKSELEIENSELKMDNDKTEDYHHLLQKVTDRSIEEIESILDRKFASLPTWKKVLKSYGPTEFIEKYQHIINWSNQLTVDINKYFNEMMLSTN